ncbi:Smr/MutS family protein [Gordonia sp. NPDC003425]
MADPIPDAPPGFWERTHDLLRHERELWDAGVDVPEWHSGSQNSEARFYFVGDRVRVIDLNAPGVVVAVIGDQALVIVDMYGQHDPVPGAPREPRAPRLTFTDEDSPVSQLLVTMLGAVAELECFAHPRTPTRGHRRRHGRRPVHGPKYVTPNMETANSYSKLQQSRGRLRLDRARSVAKLGGQLLVTHSLSTGHSGSQPDVAPGNPLGRSSDGAWSAIRPMRFAPFADAQATATGLTEDTKPLRRCLNST